MNIEEINKRLRAVMDLKNNQPIVDFEGRSPSEMYLLLHKPFDKDSPFQFMKNVSPDVLDKIPFLKMTKFFLKIINDQAEIKLTSKGNLPVKIVKELYDLRLFTSEYIDSGISSIRSEMDEWNIHQMRLICEICGLVKKQKGKLLLTVKGKKLLKVENEFLLLQELFITYTTKFNWAYNDRYGDNSIGQLGFAFSLELVSKYGNKLLPADFYATKYLEAFPTVLEQIEKPIYKTVEEEAKRCYELRTFNRFFDYFGFVELVEEGKDLYSEKLHVKKTPIFDQVIKFED